MIKSIKYTNDENTFAAIELEDGGYAIVPTTVRHIYSDDMDEWCKTTGNKIEPQYTNEERISLATKEKIDAIGIHIYLNYSEKKQSQDSTNKAYSQTVIIGVTAQTDTPITLDALTVEVMNTVLEILAGNLLIEDYVATKSDDLKRHYAKLVKVGLRLKWMHLCKDEGALAISENREPNYPEYPVFKTI